MTYTGKASLFATGNIGVNGSLVTSGNNSFPTNVIGFMTPGNIALGDSSHVDIMGLFYAETKISIDKQTNLIGSIVANQYDLGNNVPAIYQVPQTATNTPSGLIGGSGNSSNPIQLILWQKSTASSGSCP